MSIPDGLLSKILLSQRIVSPAKIREAEATAGHLGTTLGNVLVGRNFVDEQVLGTAIAKYYRVPYIDVGSLRIPVQTLTLIPEQLARQKMVIVFQRSGDTASVAMTDPKDLALIEFIKKTIGPGIRILPFVSTEHSLETALAQYQTSRKQGAVYQPVPETARDVSIVVTLEELIEAAMKAKASDIHIEPLPDQSIVRFRLDGVLHDKRTMPLDMHASLIARIKILSNLKLDETRLPQDGMFGFTASGGTKISLRVSIIPTVYGEKAVLRILEDAVSRIALDELGLGDDDRKIMESVLSRTHGMFLVTGPTGSGKTTTLYTILSMLNKPEVNIITIEDPVENRIRRVNQIQVNSSIDLTFAGGLRSVLRQDPDIIMVGEIRDHETALISVNAAMTGHLVFSTVHANTSAGAIPRLIDLGVEPFLLASTVNLVMAQRLVRIVCPYCARQAPIAPVLKHRLDALSSSIMPGVRKKVTHDWETKGCAWCNHTGFKGRMGIFELLPVDEDMKHLIVARSDSSEIWKHARKNGTHSMMEDGLLKVSQKKTTIGEVLRVISE